MELEILRRASAEEPAYVQRFSYQPRDTAETVATALTRLNEQPELRDVTGAPAAPIRWACSCLQKKCGACAMVINGLPKLACDARLSAYRKTIRLEPLRKFPVVADLIVDRSVLYRNLADMKLWLQSRAVMDEQAARIGYEASRCLQCGCCLEVCPNFSPEGPFAGMAAAVPLARLLEELPRGEKQALAETYRRRVYAGCGKSLACRNICPAKIPIDELLVNSNAIAVWKRLWKRKGAQDT